MRSAQERERETGKKQKISSFSFSSSWTRWKKGKWWYEREAHYANKKSLEPVFFVANMVRQNIYWTQLLFHFYNRLYLIIPLILLLVDSHSYLSSFVFFAIFSLFLFPCDVFDIFFCSQQAFSQWVEMMILAEEISEREWRKRKKELKVGETLNQHWFGREW